MTRTAIGLGLATLDHDGDLLDCWFPDAPALIAPSDGGCWTLSPEDAAIRLGPAVAGLIGADAVRGVCRVAVETVIADLDAPVRDRYDAYLRLHLLSHRVVAPNSISVDGLLDVMDHDVAWTSLGPCRASQLKAVTCRARAAGTAFFVRGVFIVPPMLDYVQPSGVTIADASRVLLGAYLAPGTIVTQEGLCSINAGTLGPAIIEGRVSAGVVIGAGSDVGGGASLMGRYSGGGRENVSMGERSLLGANAGLGIALGDDCIVEAGCYITAGAPVRTPEGTVVKARELAGRSKLIFRRNGQSGALEAIPNTSRWAGLNPSLHPA